MVRWSSATKCAPGSLDLVTIHFCQARTWKYDLQVGKLLGASLKVEGLVFVLVVPQGRHSVKSIVDTVAAAVFCSCLCHVLSSSSPDASGFPSGIIR